MLRTTYESAHEQQPGSLDGQVWVAADARVDGRPDLIAELRAARRECPETATDADLILHAYQVWGEECLTHLIGDFAFAIWDGRHRRLFCARDHFGVKPFYYARVANCLVLSNTLNCIRGHPAVSDALNDLAIADFLLFDMNREPGTTAFADVHRLPPAHTLRWSGAAPHVSRYWTLPLDGRVRYKRAGDYVERFNELLRAAVEDRLRTDRVAVRMSGGLDSTAVAATAKGLLSSQAEPGHLGAYTVVYDRLVPDQERYYAGLAARALGIPIHYLAADDYELYERWDEPQLHTPEPDNSPLAVIDADQLGQIGAQTRVLLSGYGADPALRTSQVAELTRVLGMGPVVSYVGREALRGRLRGLGIRSAVKRWLRVGSRAAEPPFPAWVSERLAARLKLRARWREADRRPTPSHTLRPDAYAELSSPFWPFRFESYDPGATSFPVEMRCPFFDVRLLGYLLAIPPLPWYVDKTLLRRAMRDVLPEAVRCRPKTLMSVNAVTALLRQPRARWVDDVRLAPTVDRYVDRAAVPRVTDGEPQDDAWWNLNPLGLHLWLRYSGLDPGPIIGGTREEGLSDASIAGLRRHP